MTMTAHAEPLVDRGTDVEVRLAQLWERNLGGAPARGADYFESGGDSLRGTQLLGWIQESFGVELSLLDLFEFRTVAAQRDLLVARQAETTRPAGEPSTEYRFFGPSGGALFGALHRPASLSRTGVVLCYPMGQEYMRIHRTYVELARSLAASGLHALRFDYYGCGDSEGEGHEGTLQRWSSDVRLAIRELRARTHVRDVVLAGARIGANLALDAAASEDVAGVVLWEPILSGAAYLDQLRRAQTTLLASNAVLDGYEQRSLSACFTEMIGFPISQSLYDELAAIDLARTAPKTELDALVVANLDKPELRSFADGLGTATYTATGESDGIWLKEDRQNKGLIPVHAVQRIVSWISRRNG